MWTHLVIDKITTTGRVNHALALSAKKIRSRWIRTTNIVTEMRVTSQKVNQCNGKKADDWKSSKKMRKKKCSNQVSDQNEVSINLKLRKKSLSMR